MWRERAHPVRQRAHVPVSTRAQPPPAWPVPWGDPKAEAAASHPEEPGLRRQLPGQTGVPTRSLGAAENGAPERGGEARGRERRHEERAGGARSTPGRAPEVRQGPGGRRGPPAGDGPAPQHRLSHHHREEPTTASATERTGPVLEGAAGTRLGGGGRTTCNANTHAHTHTGIPTLYTHTHAEQEDDISGKILSAYLRYASFIFPDCVGLYMQVKPIPVLTEWCVTSPTDSS